VANFETLLKNAVALKGLNVPHHHQICARKHVRWSKFLLWVAIALSLQ